MYGGRLSVDIAGRLPRRSGHVHIPSAVKRVQRSVRYRRSGNPESSVARNRLHMFCGRCLCHVMAGVEMEIQLYLAFPPFPVSETCPPT
jgi:hypothetical protein